MFTSRNSKRSRVQPHALVQTTHSSTNQPANDVVAEACVDGEVSRLNNEIEQLSQKLLKLQHVNMALNSKLLEERDTPVSFNTALDVVLKAVVEQTQLKSTLKSTTVSSVYNPAESSRYSDKAWLSKLQEESPLRRLFQGLFPTTKVN